MSKKYKALFGFFLLLVLTGPIFVWAGERISMTAEQQEVAAAARRYLEAEVKRDYPEVFRSLYPASEYRRVHDFQAYLAEARSTPVRIEAYEVLQISSIMENPDPNILPDVDGFARVEVDVRIRYSDNGQQNLVNYAFPFVRAGGKWYKL
jgi:hypothetical protein